MMSTDYYFRKELLEEKMREIGHSMLGYHTPLSQYVCDEAGAVSDQKIAALADRLANIITRVNDRYYYGILGAARKCLQLYIYLFTRAYTTYSDEEQTFGDLLDRADELLKNYVSLDDLILWESNWEPLDQYMQRMEKYTRESGEGDWETAKDWYLRVWEQRVEPGRPARGFWWDLDRSYELLAGHRIEQEKTEEELQQIWDRRQRAISPENEVREQYAGLDIDLYEQREYEEEQQLAERQYAQNRRETWRETWLNRDKPQENAPHILTREEHEAAAAAERKRQEEWKATFEDPEVFLEAYREFRRLFFAIGMDYEALEDAVIGFLCEEGKSGLADDDRFQQLNMQMDRVCRLAKKRTR